MRRVGQADIYNSLTTIEASTVLRRVLPFTDIERVSVVVWPMRLGPLRCDGKLVDLANSEGPIGVPKGEEIVAIRPKRGDG